MCYSFGIIHWILFRVKLPFDSLSLSLSLSPPRESEAWRGPGAREEWSALESRGTRYCKAEMFKTSGRVYCTVNLSWLTNFVDELVRWIVD